MTTYEIWLRDPVTGSERIVLSFLGSPVETQVELMRLELNDPRTLYEVRSRD